MVSQFWEEIMKNAKEAADITVKKTSEMTAIAKATVAIKNEEGKLSSCYKEIGRLFYTAERDGVDHTDEIATFIMQADKIKAAIAGYKKEIAALKKVSLCDACGSEVPTDAQFCPSCGAKIVKAEPAKEEKTCTCTCDVDAETEEKTECPCCCGSTEDAPPADAAEPECPCTAETAERAEDTHCCCNATETYETPAPTETGEDKPEE